ncbi:MAG: hypothetical protein HQK83_01955 [Fibrobacteria bacterium]|nr:hypothetical protein [Fibrobacteria bacterium]
MNNRSLFILILAGVIYTAFIAVYITYSLAKYDSLASRSLVQGHIEMKIINHKVKCVCPQCGTKALPRCTQCNVSMYWNGYQGAFICESCGQTGFPSCPRCKNFMKWIESL